MKPYEITYRILSSDTDRYRRLRISRMFSFLQEAAIAHTEQLGAGREKTLDRGYLWVITLQQAAIERMPEYDEAITIQSLPGERMHMFFPRYYRVLDENGETIIRASALWLLMDANERKMVQPQDIGITLPGQKPDWETFLPALPPLPKNAQKQDFTAPYSSIDLNGHMNHTRYFDLAEDLMPADLRDKNIKEIRSEFKGEVRQDEPIGLEYTTDGNKFLLSGTGERRLFRISMEYK